MTSRSLETLKIKRKITFSRTEMITMEIFMVNRDSTKITTSLKDRDGLIKVLAKDHTQTSNSLVI
jgi:hypothetical protein